MEQREGKILHSTLGNQAVGAWGLAKGEFITKSWCFYPAFFVILTFSRAVVSLLLLLVSRGSTTMTTTTPAIPPILHLLHLYLRLFHPEDGGQRERLPSLCYRIVEPFEIASSFSLLFPRSHFRRGRYMYINYIYAPCIYIFVLASGEKKNGQNGMKRRTG